MPGLRLTLLGTFALIALLIAAVAYIGLRDDGGGGGESMPPAAVAASALAPVEIAAEPALAISAQAQSAAIASPPQASASAQSASADDGMSAAEIVGAITPSVARVSTELVGAGAFGGPLPPSGAGTGIVLDEDGHILTNSHVIEGAETISVVLHDGASHDASVVGLDPATDLAVIKIAADGLSPAALGESANLLAGEDVLAVGYVMALPGAPSVSKGVVSAVGRHINTNNGNFTLIDLIQTDAAINAGNSGGPLVDSSGEVVGVNTAVVRGVQGVGFAVNIDDAKIVAAQLIANGFVRRGYVGVLPITMNPLIAAQLDMDADIEGVLLQRVLPDTPASDAGLRRLDIIQAMDGNPLPNTGELSKFLMSRAPGDRVETDILRDDDEMTVEITLGTRPDN